MTSAPTVTELLSAADAESRRVGVQEIARLAGAAGADTASLARLLVGALGDENWRVRKEAATVAARFDDHDALLPLLVDALAERENIGLRNAAVEALVALGPDAVEPAAEALDRLDADGRKLAVEVLGGVPDGRGVTALSRALGDVDLNVRAAAAEALGTAGLAGEEARAQACSALAGALSPDEPLVAVAALDALGKLDAKLPWAAFEPFVANPLLKRHAIVAAARSREDAALVALVRALADTSPTVAREALVALGNWLLFEPVAEPRLARARAELGTNGRAIEFLRRTAADSSDTIAHTASLLALGLLRDPADLPLLVEALANAEVTEHVTTALELFGRSAAEPLAEMLPNVDEPTRALLLSILPRIDPEPGSRVLAMLRDGLDDPSAEVAVASMKGLAAAGDASDLGRIVPLASATIVDVRVTVAAEETLRELAARHPGPARMLLRGLSPDAEHAVAGCILAAQLHDVPSDLEFVERALAHPDLRARRAAVDALASMTDASLAERVRAAVAFALADEEHDVRIAAIRALGSLRHAEPLAMLLDSTEEQDTVVAALRALTEADPARALAAAKPLVRREAAIACAVVDAIGHLESDARDDVLFAALEHSDAEVVKLAVSELGRKLDARTLARLGACLDHPSWEVRRLVSELLGQSKSQPGARDLLRARLDREKEPVVREALTAALSLRPPPGLDGGG